MQYHTNITTGYRRIEVFTKPHPLVVLCKLIAVTTYSAVNNSIAIISYAGFVNSGSQDCKKVTNKSSAEKFLSEVCQIL